MPVRPRIALATLLPLAGLLLASAARADEASILAALRQAFASPDRIPTLATQIAADPAYDRAKVAAWLERSAPYPALAAGRHEIVVDVGLGQHRRVTLRLPRGYTPSRAWPLIYALHPSGGDGPSFIGYLESVLGSDLEDFVVAAPSSYRQTGVDAPAPFTLDHPRILLAARREAHVDASRTYVVGYSLGGYAAWAVALLHADLVAAAVPLAATFTVPADVPDGLWRLFVDNFRHLAGVWMVWGANDRQPVYGFHDDLLGGIATLNRQYRAWTADLGLPQTLTEQPRRSHSDVVPAGRDLLRALGGPSATSTKARPIGSRPRPGSASAGASRLRSSHPGPTRPGAPRSLASSAPCSASCMAPSTARRCASRRLMSAASMSGSATAWSTGGSPSTSSGTAVPSSRARSSPISPPPSARPSLATTSTVCAGRAYRSPSPLLPPSTAGRDTSAPPAAKLVPRRQETHATGT